MFPCSQNDSPTVKSGRLANHHRQRRHIKFYAQGLNLRLRTELFSSGERKSYQKGFLRNRNQQKRNADVISLFMMNGSIGSMLLFHERNFSQKLKPPPRMYIYNVWKRKNLFWGDSHHTHLDHKLQDTSFARCLTEIIRSICCRNK